MELFHNRVSRVAVCAVAGIALLSMWACGGGGSSNNTKPVTKFPSRIYVLNSSGQGFSGFVYILNATNDNVWQTPIGVTGGTNLMVESPDKKTTLLFTPGNSNTVTRIDNATESLVSSDNSAVSIGLPGATESMAVLSDNKTVVAAVRTAPVSNAPNGAVMVLDLSNNNVAATIPVPEVRYVVTNNAASKALAFADNSDSVYLIDATAKTATAIPGFDRPVGAVFSADDSKAYVLNCGPECGGSVASVQVLNMSDNSLGANVPVNGATVGLLSSNKLYVAGTAGNAGQLDVIDTGTLTRTQSGIAITDGYHNLMAMADGGKLYIGAKNCTVSNGMGCLSIFNTTGTTAVIPTTRAPGIVTGIQPILGRNIAYVTMGGELIIFDTTADAPRPERQLDVVGNAVAVKLID